MKKIKHLKKVERESAAQIAKLLKSAEYMLIDAINPPSPLSLSAKGKLVGMQRRLRTLRYEIEAEAGI